MRRARVVRYSLCWLLAASSPVSAVWLTASELDTHCAEFANDAQSRGAAICAAFIEGVIAGERVVNGTVPAERPESFAERAARTRVGSRLPASADRPWCIDSELPAAAVLESVVTYVRALRPAMDRGPASADASGARLVERALVAAFPCSGP